MSHDLRYRLHSAVDQLPGERLADVLCFVEMLINTGEEANLDMEDAWMLSSGAFKLIVREDGELPLVIEG
jgi:hypothetical protein